MKFKTTYLLTATLVLFAFLAGSFWTKTRLAQKQPSADSQPGEETKPIQQPQEEVQVLGEQAQAEIIKGASAVKGPDGAPVTIVEFSEYQCPFCKKYVDEAYAQIMENYADQIRYIFRDYPLPFHQHSQKTAEAARCAGEQGKYWKYHDHLFANKEKWEAEEDATETLIGFGAELGLNKEKLRQCLAEEKFSQAIQDDLALGKKFGVAGTPTFFINGTKLVGAQPYQAFEELIKKELEK